MPAYAGSASGLGSTVALDLVRQPTRSGPGLVFAYTPARSGSGTTPPVPSLFNEALWTQARPGAAAVYTQPQGSQTLVGFTGSPTGAPLGYAYPTTPSGVRPLPVSAAGTTVTSNLAAGGSTWEWTDPTGTQFLNHYDLGRELQGAFFAHTPDGRLVNPTEAGDAYGDPSIPSDQRHGSPLAAAANPGPGHQVTSSIPLEWWPQVVDTIGGYAHPVLYPDVRLGKDLQLAYRGMSSVARYDTVITLPGSVTQAALEAPSAYLRGTFSTITGFDARTGAATSVQPLPLDTVGTDYVPPSGWGGLIASDPTGAHAFAIYGVTTGQGGSISNFTAHDFRWTNAPTGAGDFSTMKLRAQRMGDFPAGTTRTTAYVVTGSLTSVEAQLRQLAAAGVK